MAGTLEERISGALDAVVNRRTGVSVLRAEQVRDIATTTDGKVRLSLLLEAADDATLARDVRQAIEAIEGVSDVRVDIQAPRGAGPTGDPTPARRSKLPIMEEPRAAPRVSAPTPVAMPNLGRIIAISSGKGGVGK